MLVCYIFARWSYGEDTVHAGRAKMKPWNKPALFCSPERPGCFKKLKPQGPLPCECRFNTVYPDSMQCSPASLRCGPSGPMCPHCSNTGTKNQDSVSDAWHLRTLYPFGHNFCFNCFLNFGNLVIKYIRGTEKEIKGPNINHVCCHPNSLQPLLKTWEAVCLILRHFHHSGYNGSQSLLDQHSLVYQYKLFFTKLPASSHESASRDNILN